MITGKLNCPDNAFECKNGKTCILDRHRCDGSKDCDDGSDEAGCPKVSKDGVPDENFRCPSNLYTCANKECVVPNARCDGTKHCTDGSDEKGCRKGKKVDTSSQVV